MRYMLIFKLWNQLIFTKVGNQRRELIEYNGRKCQMISTLDETRVSPFQAKQGEEERLSLFIGSSFTLLRLLPCAQIVCFKTKGDV